MCVILLAGTWVLDKLERQYPGTIDQTPSADDVASDMSGVEAVSPHKSMATAHEYPLEIPDIGNVSTSWIGLKGVRDIKRMMEEKATQEQVKALKGELRLLAKECMKAFEVAGVSTSEEPQIKKAVDLCTAHLPQPTRPRKTMSTAIATLWKDQAGPSTHPCSEDRKDLATSVLGEKLVGVLTEESKQPPDVSIHNYCTLHMPDLPCQRRRKILPHRPGIIQVHWLKSILIESSTLNMSDTEDGVPETFLHFGYHSLICILASDT